MANRRVSVWKYVKVGKNWRYCKAVYGPNNKIKPNWVYVKGVREEHPEGNFYIMRLDGGRKMWKLVGPSAADAVYAAQVEASLMNAVAMGVPVEKEEVIITDYGVQMWKYLDSYKLAQSDESYELMKQTLGEFWDFYRKTNMAKLTDMRKLTREDMLRYKKWLVSRGRSFRTAGNKMLRVNQFLRSVQGLEAGKPRCISLDCLESRTFLGRRLDDLNSDWGRLCWCLRRNGSSRRIRGLARLSVNRNS